MVSPAFKFANSDSSALTHQDVTTAAAIVGLLGSIVSLYFSHKALQKADKAIAIEKSTKYIDHLWKIVHEIDEWSAEYEQMKSTYVSNYVSDLIYDFDEMLFIKNSNIFWEKITKFEDRLKSTYPKYFQKIDSNRETYIDAINKYRSDPNRYYSVEWVIDDRANAIRNVYREFFISRISARTEIIF